MKSNEPKVTWKKFWGHYRTISHHHKLVRQGCFKAGLYWQGLTHDLSKLHPAEFMVGARYYQGDRSPNNAEREAKGVSTAWLHHKGRNKHHLEYWLDYSLNEGAPIAGMKMPKRYVVEMLCDRIAACKTYQKENYTEASPYEYYVKGKTHYLLHEDTMRLLEELLIMVRDKGEDETFSYIRNVVLKDKYSDY